MRHSAMMACYLPLLLQKARSAEINFVLSSQCALTRDQCLQTKDCVSASEYKGDSTFGAVTQSTRQCLGADLNGYGAAVIQLVRNAQTLKKG